MTTPSILPKQHHQYIKSDQNTPRRSDDGRCFGIVIDAVPRSERLLKYRGLNAQQNETIFLLVDGIVT